MPTNDYVGSERSDRTKRRVRRINKGDVYGAIPESKFKRHILHGTARYRRQNARGGAPTLYSTEELEALEEAGVSDRLPPRATAYYLDLARRSKALRNLIKARPKETEDPAGEVDPSNQLKYSPVAGLLHKYEMVLLYAAATCSSWCRYCYRSDLFNGKTGKRVASIPEVVHYIRDHNEKVRSGEISKPLISEALLSGGDPLVLSNRRLFAYLSSLAEVGLEVLRIGTKELAFFPQRFDDNLFQMLDLFHKLYPNVLLAFMTHFTHPDEFLYLDESGGYRRDERGHLLRNPIVAAAVRRLASRSFVTIENQTPIIHEVSDDPAALRLMHRELKHMGVNNHYTFQCREIEGHRKFAVPVELAWNIHKESQLGLSGIERSRFVLATEAGKMELISVMDGVKGAKSPLDQVLEDGLVVFRLHRTPDPALQGNLVIARRNRAALWISGYEDRLLYDGRKVDSTDAAAPLLQMLASQVGDSAISIARM